MYCFRLKSGTAVGLESDYAVAAAFRFLRFFGGEYAGFFRLDLDCRQGISVHNNSCRSRCCPMCQEFPKEKWIDAQKENLLDAPYYHVVFTVPEELRGQRAFR